MNSAEPTSPATSIYLWGSDRGRLNAAARKIARRLDPGYAWVEVDSGIPAEYGGATPAAVSVKDVLPRPAPSATLFWSYLRSRGQQRATDDLREFLAMPDPIQSAVATLLVPEAERPRLLVIANADRVCSAQPRGPWILRPYIEFLASHEISVMVTFAGRPCHHRAEYEYSLTTSDSLPEKFRSDAAVCQWGDCATCLVRLCAPNELVCSSKLWATQTTGPTAPDRRVGFASH